jgi:hypothetical protein
MCNKSRSCVEFVRQAMSKIADSFADRINHIPDLMIIECLYHAVWNSSIFQVRFQERKGNN